MKGKIVAACLAPHPPHLVYAENPAQNEPRSEGGWETLRWAYQSLRESLANLEFDTFLLMSPHWRTYQGIHVLMVDQFKGLSVDPIFPHLFRYHYNMRVDTHLGGEILREGAQQGLFMKPMLNPDFRVDYGTIVAAHLLDPLWTHPLTVISSHGANFYFNPDRMIEEMEQLATATLKAVEQSGKRVVLVASQSLSHRHFTTEPEVPEDMSKEHIYNFSQYLWDMKIIELMRKGKNREIQMLMPDFIEQAVSEADSGALPWLLACLQGQEIPAKVHGYGTVIGTGNAIAEWRL